MRKVMPRKGFRANFVLQTCHRNWMRQIANCQSLVFSASGQLSEAIRSSISNECYANERQSRDSNRGTMNAGSMRTNFCV